MRLRNPLIVAVVGALLVGGATTGTTHASWVGQSNLQAASVGSGAMGIAASASAGSLTVQRGASATVRVTVNDTSSTAAKNLKQRVTPTLTGPLPGGVTASLTTVSGGGSCTGNAQGPVDLNPGGSFTTCLNVSVSSSSSAVSTTVNVGVAGAQVRGGTVGGWTTPTQTVSVPVTVQGFGSPVITCAPGSLGGGNFRYSWSAVPGAIGYGFQESSNNYDWNLTDYTTNSSTTSYTVQLQSNETLYVRIIAADSSFQLAYSNVLRLHRNGNSSNFTCQDLG